MLAYITGSNKPILKKDWGNYDIYYNIMEFLKKGITKILVILAAVKRTLIFQTPWQLIS